MMNLHRGWLPLVLAASVAVTACSDDPNDPAPGDDTGLGDTTPDDTSPGDDTSPDPVARIRVMHASWDAPAVDIYIDGEEPEAGSALDALVFGDGTAYLSVPPGSYDIAVVPNGATLEDAVFSVDGFELSADTATTFWAYGGLGDESFGVGVLEDPTSPSSTDATIQIAHAAVNVGPVDIFVDGDETFTGVALGATLEEAATLPTGDYEVGLARAGTGDVELTFDVPLQSPLYVVAFAVGNVLDPEDGAYLIALLPDGTTIPLFPRDTAEPTQTSIRVVHLSTIADDVTPAGVDICVGPDQIGPVLPFGEALAYQNVPASNYAFDVYAEGSSCSGTAALAIPGLEYAAGESYTLVAYDGDTAIQGMRITDERDVPAEDVRVRFVHNAAGVGAGPDRAVDVYLVGTTNTLLFEDIELGEASATLDTAPAALVLGADVTGDGNVDATFDADLSALAGQYVAVHAVAVPDGVALFVALESGAVLRIDAN